MASRGEEIVIRLRNRLSRDRQRAFRWAAPRAAKLTEHVAGSTVAVLEFPHQPQARWGWGKPPHPLFHQRFRAGEERYGELVGEIGRLIPQLHSIARSAAPGQPCWDNVYFPALDAAVLYALLAQRKPATYLEVGSGYSTLFARSAIKANDLHTRIVSIDPFPRADVDAVCDELHRVPLADADLALFEQLQPGDVVLVDGSHTSFMNSDSVVTWFDIVPILPAGVVLGIHDVFLPWDYPPEWADRWYGEHYLVGAFLLGDSSGWEVAFPSWFVAKETSLCDSLGELWDISGYPADWGGSSFWLEKKAGAELTAVS